MRKEINNRGQTLIEALAVLPVVMGLTMLIFFGSYIVIARKWVHYWVYRAAVCQGTAVIPSHCRSKLKEKIAYVLPASAYRLEATWVTARESHVAIDIQIASLYRTRLQSSVPLPLVPSRTKTVSSQRSR